MTSNSGSDNFPFTDHERDGESNTDATLFRHYSPTQLRWLSPDPYNGSYELSDPQSFNRYAYLKNRPMAATDPTGLDGSNCIYGGSGTTLTVNCGGSGGDGSPVERWNPGDSSIWRSNAGPVVSMGGGGGYYSMPFTYNAPGADVNADSNHGANDNANAPNNDAKKKACVQNALLQGAASVTIDAVGLIPEAGGAARMYGNWRGYRGIVADQFGAKAIGQIQNAKYAAAGASLGGGPLGGGMFDTSAAGLMSTGLTVAGFIPGLGQVSAGLSMGVDAYKTWQAVKKCGE